MPLDLVADCGNCAALCCTWLAFDAGPAFAFTKPAGVACRYITRDCRCAIHARLVERGFAGCAAYDCFGAGQRATRMLRERASAEASRDRASAASSRELDDQECHDLFALLREVHELLWMLDGASRLGADVAATIAALDREASSLETLRVIDLAPARAELRRARLSLSIGR